MVVAPIRLQRDHTGRGVGELSAVTSGDNIDGSDGVDVHTSIEQATSRIIHPEPIEEIHGVLGMRSRNVQQADVVLNDAWNRRKAFCSVCELGTGSSRIS